MFKFNLLAPETTAGTEISRLESHQNNDSSDNQINTDTVDISEISINSIISINDNVNNSCVSIYANDIFSPKKCIEGNDMNCSVSLLLNENDDFDTNESILLIENDPIKFNNESFCSPEPNISMINLSNDDFVSNTDNTVFSYG